MGVRWHGRLATLQDGQGILALFRRVFGGDRSLAHWRWKFVDNPTGRMFVCVADDHADIVGQYALLPTWMNAGGRKVLGGQSLDTMTDPAYRKQGMFVSLAEQCFAKAALDRVELLYGFPNEQSYRGFVERLGWRDLGRLRCLMRIISPQILTPVLRRWVKSRMLASLLAKPAYRLLNFWAREHHGELAARIGIRSVDAFDERFDALWAKIKGTLPIAVWKDSRYLNWRYISCPDTKYTVLAGDQDGTLVGFVVVKLVDRGSESMPYLGSRKRGYVVDLVCLPNEGVANSLLAAAEDDLRQRGAEVLFCHVFEHSPLYGLLRNQGFFEYGRGSPLVVRWNAARRDGDSPVFDVGRWHLMEGDIDTF